jgi:hypothetical protein
MIELHKRLLDFPGIASTGEDFDLLILVSASDVTEIDVVPKQRRRHNRGFL